MSLYDTFRRYLEDEVPVALATVVSGPDDVGARMLVQADGSAEGRLGTPELACRVAGDAMRLLHEERPETVSYELPEGTYEVFIDVYPVLPQLIIIGATHTAIPLSSFAKALGFRVIVTDARGAFAVPGRFPDADRVIKGWPQDVLPTLRLDESTYLVLLSHDPKFDEPTLQHVLPTNVRYIGAIGSRRTQQQRFERLRAQGFSEEQLSRIYGPVGLDIGGRTAEETALAILAEVTAVRHGRPGGFMRDKLTAVSRQPSALSRQRSPVSDHPSAHNEAGNRQEAAQEASAESGWLTANS
jgi:xanthine dehydrogenase accessory factor